jgi:hypothetical protein
VKKLISIGVALALLAMVVLPVGVAADIQPSSYAKIPFAIIGSLFEMIGDLLGLAGPLAWSVDMLAWGVALFSKVYGQLDQMFGIGYANLTRILDDVACGLRECWVGGCLNISSFNCT